MKLKAIFCVTALLGALSTNAQEAMQSTADLPLVEVKPIGELKRYAVLYSGDGGWAAIDRGVADELAEQGTLVIGVNSLRYFARERTPEDSAADLMRILNRYEPGNARIPLVLIGFSRGASVLPFIVNRLPEAAKRRISAISLIAPEHNTDLEIHLRDLIPGTESKGMPVEPQLAMLKVPTQCIYGEGDTDALCPDLKGREDQAVVIGAGHHLSNEYGAIADCIIAHVDAAAGAK